jgi:hypothetical protein
MHDPPPPPPYDTEVYGIRCKSSRQADSGTAEDSQWPTLNRYSYCTGDFLEFCNVEML